MTLNAMPAILAVATPESGLGFDLFLRLWRVAAPPPCTHPDDAGIYYPSSIVTSAERDA